MTAQIATSVLVAEDGTESHDSWIVLNASRVTAHPGQRLFDSEIAHQRYVMVTVSRCTRRRDLIRDWIYGQRTLMEVGMSMAQWGAFVSSFGDGSGVPATLFRDQSGSVAQAPVESRLGESVREVREAGDEALGDIREGYAELRDAFERGAGKRELRTLVESLGHRVANGPANMSFAAQSLVEHTENVVTKARADIEGMAVAACRGDRALTDSATLMLGAAENGGTV